MFRFTALATAALLSLSISAQAAGKHPASHYNECAATSAALSAFLETLSESGAKIPQEGMDATVKASKIFVGLALQAYKEEGRSDGDALVRNALTRKGQDVGAMIKVEGIKKTGLTLHRGVVQCVQKTDAGEFARMGSLLGL